MRFRRSLPPLVLAMVILGGCVQTVQLVVRSDASGNPVIDENHHAKPFVKPGDRVVWTCQCPPDTEFTVSDLYFVADLDDVFEFTIRHEIELKDRKRHESRIQGLESLQRKLSVADRPAESAEAMSEQLPPIQETIALLADLESTLSPDEQRDLFKQTSQSLMDSEPKWVDGRARLRSPTRVAKGIGHGLWKFTWKVRKKSDPNVIVEWDPHIVGHEEKPF